VKIRSGIEGCALALVMLTGCSLAADLDERKVDPIADGCTLPALGEARIRVANLRPESTAVDFCIRARGSRYERPVLRGGGSSCATGYRYEDVSAAFAVPVGAIDVKMIEAGRPCTAPSLRELVDVAVDLESVVTIVSVGAKDTPGQLLALPEQPMRNETQLRLRFVNAIPGSAPLYFGLTASPTPPTQVAARLLEDVVPFGRVPEAGARVALGEVDALGYWVLPAAELTLGAAPDPGTKALLALSLRDRPATYSLYAIGDPDDAAFPPRGLLCEESSQSSALTLPCVETELPTQTTDDLLDAGAEEDAMPVADAADAGDAEPMTAQTLPSGMDAATRGEPDRAPAADRPSASVDAAMPPTAPPKRELSAQYRVNGAAPSAYVVAPVLRVRNESSREPIPLRSLKLRYYFTNEHASRCPEACLIDEYWANHSLGATVTAKREYVALAQKQAYLEVSFPEETAMLRQGQSVQAFQGFRIENFLAFDQLDDYSYDAEATSFVDWPKVTVYRDDELVWGTPPP